MPLTDDAIEALRQRELPATHDRAYFDYATFGPLPAAHVRAAGEALASMAREGSLGLGGTPLLESVRAEAATLLHSTPRHVCLLTSTSEGLGLLAEGLDWRTGDEIVVLEREFDGCLAPFANLHARGVRLCVARDPFEIEEALTERARAVCVSVVDRVTGVRAPVEEIAALCRERELWLALDAAQAMGVLILDAPALGADIVTAHGYKYLLSGFGLAPTYCSDRAIAELRVPRAGWKNARLDRRKPGFPVAFDDSAARFEPTMSSIAALAGMDASLRFLNAIEEAERERRALAAARAIARGLESRGFEVTGSSSAIVSARHRSRPAEQIVAELRDAGVVASAVDGRLRVSTHVFTTARDVQALLDAI